MSTLTQPVYVDEERELLDREMRNVLIQLTIMPHGGTQQLGSAGSSHPSSKPPTGTSNPDFEQLAHAYTNATTNHQRTHILNQAKNTRDQWKRHATTTPDITIDQLVIEDGEGYQAEHVAQRFGLHTNHICRIRQRANRNPDDGTITEEQAQQLTKAERQAEVHRMKTTKGMATRQIALLLKVSQPQVVADYKAAIAA